MGHFPFRSDESALALRVRIAVHDKVNNLLSGQDLLTVNCGKYVFFTPLYPHFCRETSFLRKTHGQQVRGMKASFVTSWRRDPLQLFKPVLHDNKLILCVVAPLDHQKSPIIGNIVVSPEPAA